MPARGLIPRDSADSMLTTIQSAIPVTGVPWWIAPALIGGAGVTLLLRRAVPGVILWTIVISLLSLSFVWPLSRIIPQTGGVLQSIALICAMLCLIWLLCAAIVSRLEPQRMMPESRHFFFVPIAQIVALLLGVVTGVVVTVELVMRFVVIGIELVLRQPWDGLGNVGLESEAIWSVGLLLAACVVAYPSSRDRRLGGCVFLCAVLLTSLLCARVPVLIPSESGGYRRTLMPLLLLGALCILMVVAVGLARNVECWSSSGESKGEDVSSHPRRAWPGLSSGFTAVGIGLILLVCYHFAVPVPFSGGGFRPTTLMTSLSAAVAAGAGFTFLRREWTVGVADVSLALTSLAVCGLAIAFVPDQPARLTVRYPLVFNAMVFGLATATLLWSALAVSWDQRNREGGTPATYRRLSPYAKRFAFLNGALALVAAGLMGVWPRWPGIDTTDDSLGRVAAGLAAHLGLLLVLLCCSRWLKRFTLQILTILTVVSAAAFLWVRMAPFRPGFG